MVEYVRRGVGIRQHVALSVTIIQGGRKNLVVKVLTDASNYFVPFHERPQDVKLAFERNAV